MQPTSVSSRDDVKLALVGITLSLIVIFMDKESLIKMLHQNENDYHELPMYGLVSDWYLRYWHLHIALYQYLELDKEDYFGPWPLKQ